MAAVKLVSLTKEYQNGENYIRAVDDVSFSIKEGEFIAVIGASGSGKSTLINLISGLEKPTHGCVYVHDVNLTKLSLEEQISFRRWHIGVIFQKYNLIPAMNVFENIVLPAKLLERTVDEKEVFRLAKLWESKRSSFRCRMSYLEDNNKEQPLPELSTPIPPFC